MVPFSEALPSSGQLAEFQSAVVQILEVRGVPGEHMVDGVVAKVENGVFELFPVGFGRVVGKSQTRNSAEADQGKDHDSDSLQTAHVTRSVSSQPNPTKLRKSSS